MFTKNVFVFCFVATLTNLTVKAVTESPLSKPNPYPLYNQALKKLEQLEEIVNGSVLEADARLQLVTAKQTNYANQKQALARSQLQDEANKINNTLVAMTDIADSAGVNITQCLKPDRQNLDELRNLALKTITNCIGDISKQVDVIMDETLRKVNETRKNVNDLKKQLKTCQTGSMLCISPIVTRIDIFKIELPELIESETHEASRLIEPLTVQVDTCLSSSVVTYVSDAGAIEARTEKCVNSILPSTMFLRNL